MKNKFTALILAMCMLGGTASYASAAEYGGWSAADDISTYSTSRMNNLDIPNITSTSTVYDPDGMMDIEVIYASAGADGTLKVTVLNEIDGLTAGASLRAAVITGNEVGYAEDSDAGITEYLNEKTDESGMGYVLPGSYYILEPGTYYAWCVAASDAFCLVVTDDTAGNAENNEAETGCCCWEEDMDIPNIMSVSTAYDSENRKYDVIYASPDASGTLTVTLRQEIEAISCGGRFYAASIENNRIEMKNGAGVFGDKKGITENRIVRDTEGMTYYQAGSTYVFEEGAYISGCTYCSEQICIVVTDESGVGSGYDEPVFDEPVYDRWDDSIFDDSIYDGLGQDPNYGDPYYDEENEVFTDAEGNRFYPGNGVTNDVLITAGGDRFELTVSLAGTYSYEVGTDYGTKLHTEYLVWPECELILPDNGKIYDNYTYLHSLGMGDYVEGGCELYGGEVIAFNDPRLSCDDNGVFYGEDYTVNFLDPEITFRVVVNDITEYIPDYYNDAAGYPGTSVSSAPAAPSYSSSASFTDVAESAWYYDTVRAAADAGIIAGNADGSFNPDGELTWAQAVTFAVRLAQYRAGTHVYGAADQTDVWYQIYVDYAWDAGIVAYIPQNVNYIINRAEAALIFAKVLGNAAKINEIPENYFWDLYGSGEVGEAVNALAEAGIVNGMEDGSFGANGSFLRSQVATVVARMAGLVSPVRIG